ADRVAHVRSTDHRRTVRCCSRAKILISALVICAGRVEAMGAAGTAIYLVRGGGVVFARLHEGEVSSDVVAGDSLGMAETPLAGNGGNWISDFNRAARTGAAAAAAKDQSLRSVLCPATRCLRVRLSRDCICALHGRIIFSRISLSGSGAATGS